MSESKSPRKPRTPKSDAVATPTPKPKKVKKGQAVPQRTHFDVFSRSTGYQCTCPSEDAVHNCLQAMFKEVEKYNRRCTSARKMRSFDCYGIARTGMDERVIELMFSDDQGEEDTYEDAVEKETA